MGGLPVAVNNNLNEAVNQLPIAGTIGIGGRLGGIKADGATITVDQTTGVASATGAATLLPDPDLIAPDGSTTYDLGFVPVHPEASLYFVNGIKKIYGVFYTITGSTLTILEIPPDVGDTQEIYVS